MTDALTLRCKAMIKAGRSGLAAIDATLLSDVATEGGCVEMTERVSTQLLAIEADISHFRKARKISNRRLAKDVAAWVQVSLEAAEKHGITLEL